MSKKIGPGALSVAGVLGELTPERVLAVADVEVRRSLERVVSFATGVVNAHLKNDAALLAKLTAAEITVDDAAGLVADSLHMVDEVTARDSAAIRYHATVAAVRETDAEIAQHLGNFDLNLRAKLGPRSVDLEQFGFKPAIPGGRKKAVAAKPVAAKG